MCIRLDSSGSSVAEARIHEIISTSDQTVYSPLSLLVLLAALLGAKGPQGNTESQLRNGFLSLQNKDENDVSSFEIGDRYIREALSDTDCSPKDEPANNDIVLITPTGYHPAKFCIANSMLVSDLFEASIKKGFIEKIMNDYKSAQFSESAPKETIDKVNAWVSNNTAGMIKNLLEDIPQGTVIMLINTIYFKALWNKRLTRQYTDASFYPQGGKELPTKMIGTVESFPYFNDQANGYQVINLPFYNDKNYKFLVFLPTERFAEIQVPLNADVYAQLIKKLGYEYVDFRIPKFKIQSSHDLKPILIDTGVVDLFSSKANLSGIAESIFVSDIKQVTVIELNEYGLEGSAATKMMIGLTSVFHKTDPIKFFCDEPFSFVLYDNKRNKIVFVGRYNRPISA